jgi:hypothetical protein
VIQKIYNGTVYTTIIPKETKYTLLSLRITVVQTVSLYIFRMTHNRMHIINYATSVRSRVRFPMKSLGFSIDLTLPAAL